MANNPNYSNHKGRQNYNSNNYGNRNNNSTKEILPETVPEDYVQAAETVMRDVLNQGPSITTSKIRNLLSLVTDVYNVENLRTEQTLLPESISRLMMMRVRVLYETGRSASGRDKGTKNFIEKAKLLEYLKGIGNDRENLIRFAHYMEALVAYHRYYGGSEN